MLLKVYGVVWTNAYNHLEGCVATLHILEGETIAQVVLRYSAVMEVQEYDHIVISTCTCTLTSAYVSRHGNRYTHLCLIWDEGQEPERISLDRRVVISDHVCI